MYSLRDKAKSSFSNLEGAFEGKLILFTNPMEFVSMEKDAQGRIQTITFKNPFEVKKRNKLPPFLQEDLVVFPVLYFKQGEKEIFLDKGESKTFLELDWHIEKAFEEGTGQTGKRGEGPANTIRSFLLPPRSPKRHTSHPSNRDKNEFAYLLRKNSKEKTKKRKGGSRRTRKRRG